MKCELVGFIEGVEFDLSPNKTIRRFIATVNVYGKGCAGFSKIKIPISEQIAKHCGEEIKITIETIE